jgi:hypothetical protein
VVVEAERLHGPHLGPLSGSRVTAALERLAERRVSGILEIEGNPAGTIYLNQGQITFARASGIPDLGARLPGVLRPAAAAPDLIADPDRPDRDTGSVLVQRKYLSRAELQAILCSVIMDAALVLMAPADQDAFVSDVRFAAPGTHWAGAFSSLCVDFVLAEASKMAERVGRYDLARTTPIQLCDLAGPAAVLTREQWAVAWSRRACACRRRCSRRCRCGRRPPFGPMFRRHRRPPCCRLRRSSRRRPPLPGCRTARRPAGGRPGR